MLRNGSSRGSARRPRWLARRAALQRGLTLALERLESCRTDADLRYLLATVAALRGRTDLAEVLQDIDAVQEPCPTCATVVHPAVLRAVVDRDTAAESPG